MTTSTALLALLETEPAYGYTLKQRYDEHLSPAKPLPYGQVYASLARFERHGWADVVAVETGEGPERRRYAITEQGVHVVDDYIATPQPARETTQRTLLTRVTLALLSGRDVEAVLDAQRAVHLQRMRELTAERRDASGERLLAVTYELAHLDADVRWIEQAARRDLGGAR